MTGRRPGDFILATDMTGSGAFTQLGRMLNPAIAFAAAAQHLQSGWADPELREALVHALAANAAGHCVLDSNELERAVQDCMIASLVTEWRIAFPGEGVLQALFVIARFEPSENTAGAFELVLQLAGKPAFDAL
jgi:hypothetical protein